MAKKALTVKDYPKAMAHLMATEFYPHNLGEGKLTGTLENDIHYWMGCTYAGWGKPNKASEYWEKAAIGNAAPSAAMFYNDPQPDKIFYQGLALLQLNRQNEANSKFNKLKDYGEKHIFDKVTIDYFAVSLPDLLIWDDDLQRRNTSHCQYLMGLGYLGLGNLDQARDFFSKILEVDTYHIGSRIHRHMSQ